MNIEKQDKLFKNSANRNWFTKEVICSIEACHSHVELICLYHHFETLFEQMATGDDMDKIAMHIIEGRYKCMHARIQESEDWVRRIIEETEESAIKMETRCIRELN